MSLHFPLYVNETLIGYFSAQRIEGEAEADSINTYKVKIWLSNPSRPGSTPDKEYEVKHRYGDGAWVLIKKAIRKAEVLSAYKKAWNPQGLTQEEFLLLQILREQP